MFDLVDGCCLQDGEPCRVGVAMTDLSTGLYAVGAICAALLHRKETGHGQHIDCNLFNTQVDSESLQPQRSEFS